MVIAAACPNRTLEKRTKRGFHLGQAEFCWHDVSLTRPNLAGANLTRTTCADERLLKFAEEVLHCELFNDVVSG